ncbi:MAG TPA: hypothetical protein VHM20_00230, partial [Gammaproteobacteria bacterium]|nr:hypothetical protein [Gammaproteobacteria bacterium]
EKDKIQLFNQLLVANDFQTATRFIHLSAIYSYPALEEKDFYVKKLTALIPFPHKIKEFYVFAARHQLIKNTLNIEYMVAAARQGQLPALKIFLELHHHKPDLKENLKIGLEKLIKDENFRDAGLWLKEFYKEEEIQKMELSDNIEFIIKTAIQEDKYIKLKSILNALPPSFIKLNDLKSAPIMLAAKLGNLPIIELLKTHGATINSEIIFLEYLEHGLKVLIASKKYQSAYELITKYSLQITDQIKKYLHHQLCAHAHDASNDGKRWLTEILDLIKKINEEKIIDRFFEGGGPPLFYAAQNGNFTGIEKLIANGANSKAGPDARGYFIEAHLICCYGNLLEHKNFDKMEELFRRYPSIPIIEQNFIEKLGKGAIHYLMYRMLHDEAYPELLAHAEEYKFSFYTPDLIKLLSEKLFKYANPTTQTEINHLDAYKKLVKNYMGTNKNAFLSTLLVKALKEKKLSLVPFVIQLFESSSYQHLIRDALFHYFNTMIKNSDEQHLLDIYEKHPELFSIRSSEGVWGWELALPILIKSPKNQNLLIRNIIQKEDFSKENIAILQENNIKLDQLSSSTNIALQDKFLKYLEKGNDKPHVENIIHFMLALNGFHDVIEAVKNPIIVAMNSTRDSIGKVNLLLEHKATISQSDEYDLRQWLIKNCKEQDMRYFIEFVTLYHNHAPFLSSIHPEMEEKLVHRLLTEKNGFCLKEFFNSSLEHKRYPPVEIIKACIHY